jgi:hypothetical protein
MSLAPICQKEKLLLLTIMEQSKMSKKFSLGVCVATPAARAMLAKHSLSECNLIDRHVAGDWGDLSEDGNKINDSAIESGDQILSVYKLGGGDTVWIITEHDRSVTTVLLPEDY